MTDFSHLHALETRLEHERVRRDASKNGQELALRNVWVAQIEREIASERSFLGLDKIDGMADEELLAELLS